jgi:hypothetical protein
MSATSICKERVYVNSPLYRYEDMELTGAREGLIFTNHRRRILLQDRPHRRPQSKLVEPQAHKAPALGYGRHRALPLSLTILLPRRRRRNTRIRCEQLAELRAAADIPERCAGARRTRHHNYSGRQQGRRRRWRAASKPGARLLWQLRQHTFVRKRPSTADTVLTIKPRTFTQRKPTLFIHSCARRSRGPHRDCIAVGWTEWHPSRCRGLGPQRRKCGGALQQTSADDPDENRTRRDRPGRPRERDTVRGPRLG